MAYCGLGVLFRTSYVWYSCPMLPEMSYVAETGNMTGILKFDSDGNYLLAMGFVWFRKYTV